MNLSLTSVGILTLSLRYETENKLVLGDKRMVIFAKNACAPCECSAKTELTPTYSHVGDFIIRFQVGRYHDISS